MMKQRVYSILILVLMLPLAAVAQTELPFNYDPETGHYFVPFKKDYETPGDYHPTGEKDQFVMEKAKQYLKASGDVTYDYDNGIVTFTAKRGNFVTGKYGENGKKSGYLYTIDGSLSLDVSNLNFSSVRRVQMSYTTSDGEDSPFQEGFSCTVNNGEPDFSDGKQTVNDGQNLFSWLDFRDSKGTEINNTDNTGKFWKSQFDLNLLKFSEKTLLSGHYGMDQQVSLSRLRVQPRRHC